MYENSGQAGYVNVARGIKAPLTVANPDDNASQPNTGSASNYNFASTNANPGAVPRELVPGNTSTGPYGSGKKRPESAHTTVYDPEDAYGGM